MTRTCSNIGHIGHIGRTPRAYFIPQNQPPRVNTSQPDFQRPPPTRPFAANACTCSVGIKRFSIAFVADQRTDAKYYRRTRRGRRPFFPPHETGTRHESLPCRRPCRTSSPPSGRRCVQPSNRRAAAGVGDGGVSRRQRWR